MADTTMQNGDERSSLLSNILAIIGFIILIVVVIWGLVHLASISRDWFSSLFGGSSSSIVVNAPATTTSGTPFTISWKYASKDKGTYAFLYQCRSGFQFQTPGTNGTENGVPCGAAFTVAGTDNKLVVTPFLSGNTNLKVPLSIIFMPTATGTQVQGSASTTVVPSTVVTPAPAPIVITPAPNPTPAPTPAPAKPAKPTTPADLAVTVISLSTDAYGNGVATFDIANRGGSSTGSYYFTAQLPTSAAGSYNYTSPSQVSLASGGHVLNTLRFSQAVSGVFSVSVNGSDSNKSNNYASQNLGAQYLPTGQAGNYNYQNTYNNSSYNYAPYTYSQTAGYGYQYQTNPTPYTTYQNVPGYGYTNVYNQYPNGYNSNQYYQTQYPYTY